MITQFKIFENNNLELYAYIISLKDLQFFYDKIKEFNLNAKFYKINKNECIIFAYIPYNIKNKFFILWQPQIDDFMSKKNNGLNLEVSQLIDPEIYLSTQKYNL